VIALGQGKNQVTTLIEQGIALNDSGKYSEATDKYYEALKIDPANLRAKYELAFTLSNSGKPDEAIPYLEKVAASNTIAAAYDLLGSIYDDKKDSEKAIAYYKLGLIAFPNYERLHFNLGISYLRLKKYPEAEAEGIGALKLDPNHASAHRLYALAMEDQGKRAQSLLAWCNFLLLEPQTKRSAEALANLKYIVNYGISKKDSKNINISISPKDTDTYNLTLPMAVLASTLDKKNLTPVDSLNLQLSTAMQIIGEQSASRGDFFSVYYAKYFDKLAKSDNMQAFTHYISLTAYKDEDVAWFKTHEKELNDLQAWTKDTKRGF
jgi:tetratricopeptide (TPR) repeat protein